MSFTNFLIRVNKVANFNSVKKHKNKINELICIENKLDILNSIEELRPNLNAKEIDILDLRLLNNNPVTL